MRVATVFTKNAVEKQSIFKETKQRLDTAYRHWAAVGSAVEEIGRKFKDPILETEYTAVQNARRSAEFNLMKKADERKGRNNR